MSEPEITLEVGKKYRTRNGREIKIVKTFSSADLVQGFQSDHFTIYVHTGKVAYRDGRNFLTVFGPDNWDIVEEIDPKKPVIGDILRHITHPEPMNVPVPIGTEMIEINIQPRDKPLTIVVRQHGLPVEINLTFGVGA